MIQFTLRASGLESLRKQLKEELQLSDESKDCFKITYLDSFDWQVYRKKAVLGFTQHGEDRQLHWRQLNSSTLRDKTPLGGAVVVDYAANLPDGKLKSRLVKVLGARAMMRVATIQINRQTLVKRNEDDKIILRIHFDTYKLLNPHTGTFALFEKRILLVPLRGYSSTLTSVAAHIAEKPALCEVGTDIAETLFERCGFKHIGNITKSDSQLDAELPIAMAAKIILNALFETLMTSETRILHHKKPKNLHNYRIAVRKTRALLHQLKGVYDSNALKKFKKAFKWLGEITTPPRDMDVYRQKFDEYRQILPEDRREHLVFLRDRLSKKQEEGYNHFIQALTSQRYQQLKQDYQIFLQKPEGIISRQMLADKPVLQVANQRIWKLYKQVLKEGHAIHESSPSTELHELRKTCKKLRYMIEFFQVLYNKKKIRSAIMVLKKLQENLGDYNDLSLQQHVLHDVMCEVEGDAVFDENNKRAMDYLNRYLQQLGQMKRAEFASLFREYSAKKNLDMFHKLFRPDKTDTTSVS